MTHPHETTYLIDGSGYIFRAFYAISHLSNKEGFPTNALFGFLKMVLKTVAQANSSNIAMVFDAGRKTFRNDLYPEYKANRAECPPELLQQMPYFRELSRAIGLPVLESPGYEADDIIATLAAKLIAKEKDVVIVSGDKDLMQLVTDRVTIWDTMKDKRYGPSQVEEKFGVGPKQVTEVLALTGDTSDNVPGVDGIGPKTATQLIVKYHDVEGVISNLEAIKNDSEIRNRKKIAETIESSLDQLRLSRKLVEVDRNVPLQEISGDGDNIEELLRKRDVDASHLAELFEKFEFTSLFKEFKNVLGSAPRPKATENFAYKTILANDFPAWREEFLQQKEFAFDLETTSLQIHEAKIVGLSFCWDDATAYYIPVGHVNGENQVPWDSFVHETMRHFANPHIKKCGQNVKYDISILELNGVAVEGVPIAEALT